MIDTVLDRAVQERARGALVGLAIGDALGAPVEFKDRDSFPEVREMLSGGCFKLPAGAWTDDTAMALCLADSLIHDSDLDARDLLNRFLGWIYANENTSTGQCIGVGQNTFAVLGNYRRTGALTAPPVKGRSDGNGALMRLAPVACRHWADPAKARLIARSQSYTTHASELSAAACDAMAAILCDLIAGQPWQDALSRVTDDTWPEEIRVILAGSWNKPRNEILSSGYVVHTLEAALWAVGTTSSFEEALIAAVNLGNDADTVGAVAGQLAGARYGIRAVPARWSDMLIECDKIDTKARSLIAASGGTGVYVPGIGKWGDEGIVPTEPYSGEATMGLLEEFANNPQELALNLGESEAVREALRQKYLRDLELRNAGEEGYRGDIQNTRRFFSEADWPKAVEMIRKGLSPAAALAALGYSTSALAEERE